MSRIKVARTVAVAVYGAWKKLPEKQRKQAIDTVRKHGTAIVKNVAKARVGTKK